MVLEFDVTGSDVTDVSKAFYKHKFLREWKTKGEVQFVQFFIIESFSLRVDMTLTICIIIEFKTESYAHITVFVSGGRLVLGAVSSRERDVYERVKRLAHKRGWELSGYN